MQVVFVSLIAISSETLYHQGMQLEKKLRYSYQEFLRSVHALLKPETYLEIGVRDGSSLCLSSCASIGVDPRFNISKELNDNVRLFEMTSDTFFEERAKETFLANTKLDMAFIDGLHLSEFAFRDFLNVLHYSKEDTLIILDDIIPSSIEITAREKLRGGWTGDVYKVARLLKTLSPQMEFCAVDTKPSGLMLITGAHASDLIELSKNSEGLQERLKGHEFSYASLDELRQNLLPQSIDHAKKYLARKYSSGSLKGQ